MSVRVMQAVWEHSRMSGGALVLLLAIADNAHDDGGGAYPSVDTLAKKARMTGRNVNILLKELAAAGEIAIDPGAGPRGTNVYRVLLPGLATPENISPPKTFHPEKCDAEGVKNPAGGGEKIGKGGVKEVSPKPSSRNHQENHQGEPPILRVRARDELFEALCHECGIDWHGVTERERGKLNAAVQQIRKAGATPEQIVAHAANYRLRFSVPLTPNGLAGNWALTATPPEPPPERQRSGGGRAAASPPVDIAARWRQRAGRSGT